MRNQDIAVWCIMLVDLIFGPKYCMITGKKNKKNCKKQR